MNKLLVWVLLCGSMAVHSKTWSPIMFEPDHLEWIDEAPQVIDQKLIFRARYQNNVGLWVYDTETNQTSNLLPGIEEQHIYQMVQFKGEVYFLLKPPDSFYLTKLWKTDGTQAGTTQVSDVNFRRGQGLSDDLNLNNNILFGSGENGVILAYDGFELAQYDFQLYDKALSRLCVFTADDFIVYDFFEPSLSRITGASLTDLTAELPEQYRIVKVVKFNNDCYFMIEQGSSYNDPVDVIKISQSGDVKLLSDTPGLEHIHQVFEFNDKLFALKTGPEYLGSAHVLGFVGDTTTIDFTWSMENGRFAQPIIIDDKLFIQFNQRPGFNTRHYYLDTDFSPKLFRVATDYQSPERYVSTNNQVLVFTDRDNRNQIEIDVFNDDQTIDSVRSNGFAFKHATSAETAEEIYYVLQNRTDGSLGIYTLNDEPSVGKLLNGLWVAPGLNNQGLSIRQGQRRLGSTYITVTFYTFRDGDPLWLAGVADYLPNQQSIGIDLFEYAGTNFLELVEEPIAEPFGRINLQMSACDQLQTSISHHSQVTEINFRRINNTNNKNLCLSQINP